MFCELKSRGGHKEYISIISFARPLKLRLSVPAANRTSRDRRFRCSPYCETYIVFSFASYDDDLPAPWRLIIRYGLHTEMQSDSLE